MKHGLGLNKILGTIHIYPTLAEANKYAAGDWKKAHAPQRRARLGRAVPRLDARRKSLSVCLRTWSQRRVAAFDHSHAAWDALLRKHVVLLDGGKASQLRYAGIAQDRAALKALPGQPVARGRGRVRGLEPGRSRWRS